MRLVVTLVWLALLVAPMRAEARSQREVSYRYEQVWSAVVRMLRVDMRFPIEERDQEQGFLLFQYVEYGRTHPASLELVRADADAATPRVRVVVHIEGMSAQAELAWVDTLETKLRTDYGPPARPPVVADARRPANNLVPRLSPRPSRDPNAESGEADSGSTSGDGARARDGADSSSERPSQTPSSQPEGDRPADSARPSRPTEENAPSADDARPTEEQYPPPSRSRRRGRR